jgi:hypothetical protein
MRVSSEPPGDAHPSWLCRRLYRSHESDCQESQPNASCQHEGRYSHTWRIATARHASNRAESRGTKRALPTTEDVSAAKEQEASGKVDSRGTKRALMTPDEVIAAKDRHASDKAERRAEMRALMTPDEMIAARDRHASDEAERRSEMRALMDQDKPHGGPAGSGLPSSISSSATRTS